MLITRGLELTGSQQEKRITTTLETGSRLYLETKSKTKRYYNSPLAFMRRRANALVQATEILMTD